MFIVCKFKMGHCRVMNNDGFVVFCGYCGILKGFLPLGLKVSFIL